MSTKFPHTQATRNAPTGAYRILGLLCLLCVVVIAGCIDNRKSNRSAITRPLNRSEKARIQRAMLRRAPSPRFRLNALLRAGRTPSVLVYGLDISPYPIQRGKKVTLTYYLKALRRFRSRWGIFLHLQASSGRAGIVKNLDHHPVGGLYHTQRWRKNQIFKSTYSFVMPKDFPGKQAYFYTGFWKGNQRMVIPNTVSNDGRNRMLLAKAAVSGAGLEAPLYIAYRIDSPIKIDGKLDDHAWKHIPSTGRFRTYNNRKARFRTEAKIAWDKTHLYVSYDLDDNDIYSKYKKRDDPLFKQENVEFFIDANRNRKDYIELQVSPAGVIFDSFFQRYRYPRPWGDLSYNSGMEVGVHLRGTLNKRDDRDKGWSVEFRLPFSKLGPARHLPPKDGDEWLINMFRLERSRYTGAQDHAWSPVTLGRGGDYHQISRYGTLRFSTKVAGGHAHAKKAHQHKAPPTPRMNVIKKKTVRPKALLAPKHLRVKQPSVVKKRTVILPLRPPVLRFKHRTGVLRFQQKGAVPKPPKTYKCPPKKRGTKGVEIKNKAMVPTPHRLAPKQPSSTPLPRSVPVPPSVPKKVLLKAIKKPSPTTKKTTSKPTSRP